MTTGVILQARMGSMRLPGKVLMELDRREMLGRIVEQLHRCRQAQQVIIATSDSPADDRIAAWAEARRVSLFRGSEHDVLDRYVQCARSFGLRKIVRATADNPFVDPEEGDRLITVHAYTGVDYAATVGLPVGVGLEAMTRDALERSWTEGRKPHHREHVNEYILENPALFRIVRVPAPPGKWAPEVRLTVDTAEDLDRAERLLVDFRREVGVEDPPTTWIVRRCLGENGGTGGLQSRGDL